MIEIGRTMANLPPWAGSAPGWIMAITLLAILWRGLPGVLDSWSNSIAKERMHRRREIRRLENQIRTSDKRHEDCMEGQHRMQEEIETMRREHNAEIAHMRKEHLDEVEGLRNYVSGLMVQLRQLQFSAVPGTLIPTDIPPDLAGILIALNKLETPQ